MKLNELKKNSQNPRVIKDVQFERLCNSVIEFPNMLLKRRIAYAYGMILGGNQRYEVLKYIKKIGKQQVIDKLTEKNFTIQQIERNLDILNDLFNDKIDNYIIDCSDMTENEQKKFIVLDNNDFGEWDIDLLTALYDTDELLELGCEFPQFDNIENEFDFSDKNNEIDVNDFEDKMTIKLNYIENEYLLVREQLSKIADTPEKAVWRLLGNE